MTETVPAPEDAAAARAADQARLRKERREAKIKAGGTARLNKITGLGGGFQRGMRYDDNPSFVRSTKLISPMVRPFRRSTRVSSASAGGHGHPTTVHSACSPVIIIAAIAAPQGSGQS